MPRISSPYVSNIGAIQDTDLLAIDRPNTATANNVAMSNVREWLYDNISTDYVQSVQEINNHPLSGDIFLTAGDVYADPVGTAQNIINYHNNIADPHPQYLTLAEASGTLVVSVNGQDGTVIINANSVSADSKGTALALITTHLASADPHPQYLTLAEASGALVKSVNGHTGIVILNSVDVSADSLGSAYNSMYNHVNSADPHTQYLLNSELSGLPYVSSVNGHTGIVILNSVDVSADASGTAVSEINNHINSVVPHTQYILSEETSGYVKSVNGLSGEVILDAISVSADPTGTADALIAFHNGTYDPHPQYIMVGEGASGASYVYSVNGRIGDVILTATEVSAQSIIPVGTTTQYYRGDKTWANFTTAVTAIAPPETVTSLGATILGSTSTTASDLDSIPFIDNEASNILKRITWANIKSTLKTYFDGLFSPITGSSSITTVGAVTGTSFNSITGLGTAPPLMNNAVSSVGSSSLVSRQDHVHQSDSSKAGLVSPQFITPNLGSASVSSLSFGGNANLYSSAPNILKTDGGLIINNGLTVIGTMTTDRTVLNGYNLTTISTIPNQVLMFAPANVYRTMELTIQGINEIDLKYHTSKMLVMSNGSDVIHVEYGSINIGGVVCTFSVDFNAGNMRVLVTPVSANTTNFSVTALLTKI